MARVNVYLINMYFILVETHQLIRITRHEVKYQVVTDLSPEHKSYSKLQSILPSILVKLRCTQNTTVVRPWFS